MAYYCTNCGTPLDAEGRCPRCDAAPTPSAALGAFTPPIPGPYDHRPKFEPVLPGEEDEGTTVLKSDDMPEFYMEHPARAWQTTAAQPDKTQRREKPRVAVPQKKGLGKGAKLASAAICVLLGVALLVGRLFLTGVIRVKDGAPAAEKGGRYLYRVYSHWDSASFGEGTDTVEFDEQGRAVLSGDRIDPIRTDYDEKGRSAGIRTQFGEGRVTYEDTATGSKGTVTYQLVSGVQTDVYEYDANARLQTVETYRDGALRTRVTYAYTPAGRLQTSTAEIFDPDGSRRDPIVTQYDEVYGAYAPPADAVLTYDADGNVIKADLSKDENEIEYRYYVWARKGETPPADLTPETFGSAVFTGTVRQRADGLFLLLDTPVSLMESGALKPQFMDKLPLAEDFAAYLGKAVVITGATLPAAGPLSVASVRVLGAEPAGQPAPVEDTAVSPATEPTAAPTTEAPAPAARDLLAAAFDESCGGETLAGYYIADLDTDGTDDMVVAVAAVNSAKHILSVRLYGYTVENGQAVQKASFTIGPDVYDGMFGEINTPPSVENGDWAERLEIYVNDAGYISVNTDFRMNEWSAHYLLLRYRYGQLAEVAHLYDPGYTSGTGLYEYAAYSSDDSAVRDAGCLYYADYEGVQGRYTDYVTAINQEFAMYGFTFAAGEGPAVRDVPAHVAEGTGAVPLIRFRNDK